MRHPRGGSERVRRDLVGALSALLVLGCGKLAGVDDYAVGEPPVETPCGPLEVPRADGHCVRVGVETCATGFDDDGVGGCKPHLPAAGSCGPGKIALPGTEACAEVGNCFADFPLPGNPPPTNLRYVRALTATVNHTAAFSL